MCLRSGCRTKQKVSVVRAVVVGGRRYRSEVRVVGRDSYSPSTHTVKGVQSLLIEDDKEGEREKSMAVGISAYESGQQGRGVARETDKWARSSTTGMSSLDEVTIPVTAQSGWCCLELTPATAANTPAYSVGCVG